MKHALTLIAVILLAPLAALPAAAPAEPNIIFILVDDMGWNDLRCYGHPYAKTPNIDKLAGEGTRFQQCYATGVTCCPSRTGFMTSKFPATYAKYPANGGFGDRVTITELLHKQCYATGHFRKWHIGGGAKSGTYGIDEVGSEDGEGGGKKKAKRAGGGGGVVRGRDAHIYDEAIRFIEKHKGGPFYINIWDHIPHHPVNPSPAVIEAFGPLQVDESKFRGGKHNQYEGGVRIPFIVRWPGHVPAGRVDEKSVISGADWLPTLCAITGTKINASDFDGEDASAAWLGKAALTRTKPLLWKTSAPNSEGAIRDGQWKLHHPNSRRGELALYDITTDPGERTNLVKQHPDIVKQLSP